jgi:sugar phosphate permease
MTNSNPYQAPAAGDTARGSTPGEMFADPAGDGGKPTNIRFGVLGFAVSMSLLLYLHRFALSVAMPPIKTELGLDDEQLGIATGVFFYVYALAQVPAGVLSDRLGARLTLTLYVVLWSLALAGMGFIGGLYSLVIFRGLLGLAQAGAYPCIASVNKRWFPVHRRGIANSLTTMGGRTGGMLATLLTPQLMLLVGLVAGMQSGQWRWVFAMYAILGVAWALGFYGFFRESPDEHARCNDQERRFIRGADSPAPEANVSRAGLPVLPVAAMARSRTMWLLCGISVFVNFGWIFLVTFLPTYLTSVHKYSLAQVGFLAALPGLASMLGGVLGGVSTDFLVKNVGLVWGRRTTGLVATIGAGMAYLGCLALDHPIALVALFAGAGFLIDFGLGSLWAVYQDIAGKQVASILGFANMCGNLAAGFFPWVIGIYAKQGQWNAVFLMSAAALFVTASCWLFVDPRQKLAAD